jgi:GNAT superfamily N-acetyltransferase
MIKELEELVNSLEEKYHGLDLYISVGPEYISLSKIVVSKDQRNIGIGTAVMIELTEFADKHSLYFTLTPDNSFGGSMVRLKKFYKRFGFKTKSVKHLLNNKK